MIDKELMASLLGKLGKEEISNTLNDVLLVDSTNVFIRGHASNNFINKEGDHFGGLISFLRAIGNIVRQIKPKKVVLVFDGDGNSANKKNLYGAYKANRGTGHVINRSVFFNKQEEDEAMDTQMGRLIQYLKQLPVSLVSIDSHEADDVIGFLANYYKEKEDVSSVVIVSTDRDYYQLIEDKVKVFNPKNREFVTEKYVYETFGVYPKNFLTLKTLIGDKSDNVPGVEGMQEKTALKRFPELGSSETIKLKDIYELAQQRINEHKIYSRVVNFKHQLNINLRLMDIMKPNIGESYQRTILESIEKEGEMNSTNFTVLSGLDQIQDNFESMWILESFGYLKKAK